MPLPHFVQIGVNDTGGVGSLPQEVVYKNLFEVTFVLPTILQAQGRDPILLLQQTTKIGGLDLTPTIDVAQQNFKYSTRAYLKTPSKTHLESVKLEFNVNQNQQGSMEVWNALKAWYDLAWNSQNGTLHYKADTIGTIIINQHDKKGYIIRRITLQNAQLKGLDSYELDWGSNEIINTGAEFVVDYWIDEYIDNGYVINPPIIAGY